MSNLIQNMIASGELSPAARDMSEWEVLSQWAEANAVERVDVQFSDGHTEDGMGWEAITQVDGTRTVTLKDPCPINDYTLYYDTDSTETLESLDHLHTWMGVPTNRTRGLVGLDMRVTNMWPAD